MRGGGVPSFEFRVLVFSSSYFPNSSIMLGESSAEDVIAVGPGDEEEIGNLCGIECGTDAGQAR